jgi:hypothetical protein
MSADRFYKYINDAWHSLSEAELSACSTDFWVDLSHGGNVMVDERYYFSSLSSALEFYAEGWKQRKYFDDDGKSCGLDHSGIYSGGRLIQDQSAHGDISGHEGEGLAQTVEEIER